MRRKSFAREQEQELLRAFDDPASRLKGKVETRVLFRLCMFTGQRLKACALLGWDSIDLGRQRIWVKQFETGVEVATPVFKQLLDALPAAGEWQAHAHVLPSIAENGQVDEPVMHPLKGTA